MAESQTEEAEDQEIARLIAEEAQEGPIEETPSEEVPSEEPTVAEVEEPAKPEFTVPASVAADLRKERNELRGELSTLRSEMAEIVKAIREGKEPQEVAPNFEESPVEHLAYQSKQAIQEVNNLKKMLQDQATEAQANRAQQQIVQIEQRFAQDTPDYWQAEAFVRQRRLSQYQNYFGMSEEDALRRYGEESGLFIQAQTRQGKNFAEALYELAKAEGYNATEPAAPKAEAPKVDPEESLKATAKKLAQARSLAGASGKASKGDELTPEDVNAMSDEEFDKNFTGPKGTERLRQIMGG